MPHAFSRATPLFFSRDYAIDIFATASAMLFVIRILILIFCQRRCRVADIFATRAAFFFDYDTPRICLLAAIRCHDAAC